MGKSVYIPKGHGMAENRADSGCDVNEFQTSSNSNVFGAVRFVSKKGFAKTVTFMDFAINVLLLWLFLYPGSDYIITFVFLNLHFN